MSRTCWSRSCRAAATSAPRRVADFTTMVRKDGGVVHAEATVKVEVGGAVYHTAASGNGPVNALDAALRKALLPRFPGLKNVSLHDYKVRILDGSAATAATTRVLIESGKGLKRWTTVAARATSSKPRSQRLSIRSSMHSSRRRSESLDARIHLRARACASSDSRRAPARCAHARRTARPG